VYRWQVERANDMILQGLRPRILTKEGDDVHAQLSTRAGKWAVEVPSVLWSLRTTPNRSTNFTPDERLGSDLLRGRGKSIGGDLDIDDEGSE
jgi:hypothetical protein